jgi:hypothetical protein
MTCAGGNALQASTAVPFDEMAKRDMARWTSLRMMPSQPVAADAREAVKALIVANHFLETDLEETEGGGLNGVCARKVVRGGAA